MDLSQFKVAWQEVESSDFKPLPPGHYAAKIKSSELVDSADKTGKNIKIVLTTLGGKGIKNRFVNVYIPFVRDQSEKGQKGLKYGLRVLKQLLKAVDIEPDQFLDTNMLNGILVGVELEVQEQEGFKPSNKVKNFIPYDEELLESDAA